MIKKTSHKNLYLSYFCIATLFALLFIVERISGQFDYLIPILQRPTYLLVTLMCLAGLCYFVLIKQIIEQKSYLPLFSIFIIGLLLRLLFVDSTPIFEDDFYRYFFDGSLTYHGLNPYIYAPQEALERTTSPRDLLLGIESTTLPPHPDLQYLADQSLINRIAYPHIQTIYPAITQLIFTLSYAIDPFNLIVWRCLLLLIEVVSFVLLVKLLKSLNKPLIWSAIYWLNPLIISEIMNAGHMDALIVTVILSTLLLAVKKHYSLAGVSLAIAVGIKIWPILLLPSLFRPLLFTPKKLIKALIPCCFVLVLVMLPQLLTYTNEQSGLVNYSQYWRTNSFIFGLLEDGLIYLEQRYAFYFGDPQTVARYFVVAIILLLMIIQLKNKNENIEQLNKNWLIIVACLFFLSPTGYPWYVIWFLPFITIRPNLPLLSLTVLLPLYNLRYPLNELQQNETFNSLYIPMQFLPPIIFIMFGLLKSIKVKNKKES